MLHSEYKSLCPVDLPYRGRQLRYGKLDAAKLRMPDGYRDYLYVVGDLLDSAKIHHGTVYLTVDEKVVQPGQSQRRPGPHVDGCFQQNAWVHPPIWNHYCNHVPVTRMPVIVAASVPGCIAWRGQFDTAPNNVGDLSHAADLFGAGELLPADVGYLFSPDCVHESIVFTEPTQRTFIRLALPVNSVELAPVA